MGNSQLPKIEYCRYISEPQKEGETGILRNPETEKGLHEVMHLGCKTMWDAFEINLKNGRGKNEFLGYRKRISKDELEKKYTWYTYDEANEIMLNFSRGLNVLNLCPEQTFEGEGTYRFLGIYSRNKPEWVFTYLGAIRDSITIVTIYDTLGDLALEHTFEETQLTTVVCEIKSLKKMILLGQQKKTFQIKNIVVIEKQYDEESCKKLEELGFNIISFETVVNEGKEKGQNIELKLPDPEGISAINYTSGTSGRPKGAKIAHKSVILNTDVWEMFGIYPPGVPGDTYLSFLPMAHSMENMIMGVVLSRGFRYGIYNGDVQKLMEDFQILQPDGICAVPKIFQKIYDAINSKLDTLPAYKRNIFNMAVKTKMKNYEETGKLTHVLYDKLVFSEVRRNLGGKLRFMLVGSAPVDGYLLNYLKCVLNCQIMEGYGQTEDAAGVLLTRVYDPVTGHVGGPGYSLELKLIDVPELSYTTKDINKETGKLQPRGELLVRGPILFRGYFRDPERTKEALDEDGWLHSGDVFTLLPEHGNALKIIDRAKNIFKLQQGEYIAPEKIENIYSGCKYVFQMFIYGDSLQSYLIAILVPDRVPVIEFLKNKGIKDVDEKNYKNYFDDQDLIKDIVKTLDTFGRANGLKGFELPKKVYLSKETFSVDNNVMTPTMKIRRHFAKDKFLEQINNLYNSQ